MAAKPFEVEDVLPSKIRIFFDTESDYYHLYKPISFPDLEPILGVKCGASLFPVAIFNPDVFPPEDDFESDNYVFFSDGNSLIKIYDLTTNTWLTSRITCDLSGFTDAERTVSYVTNSYPVTDFLDGITYESREYYNIYFNNVYVGEMPALKLVDVSKIPDTLPVPVRAGYTFIGWFNEDYTIQYFGGEALTDDIDLYATWSLTAPSGYTITFNSNGGTTISDIEEAPELPNPLPIPTKSGYKFVAWYYESNFQTRAVAGATIEEDTTLYAKWHNLGSLFTEIANAIREKESSSGTIRDVDFGERVKQIQGAKEEETKTITPNFSSGNEVVTPTSGKVMTQVTINKDSNLIADNIKKDVTVHGITGTSYIATELTQTQYDALSTKDSNTYYLIVEVE